ncbi:MAG: hypothetical protein H6555_05690 [Lewinellaceae bacterium]|nr:hypothetical protein [Lewinellaceae bacterium]
MPKTLPAQLPFFAATALLALLTWSVQDHAFFWDTLGQASRRAHWYYDQQFRQLYLPPGLDAGHPPLFNIYLAACWTVFGKTLAVSHWAVFPWLVGIYWQLTQLLRYFFPQQMNWQWAGLGLFLIDPVLLGQSTLVAPDLVLVFAFLLGSRSILRQQRGWLFPALLLLLGVSLRGMFIAAGLFLWDAWFHYLYKNKAWRQLRWWLPYLGAFSLLALFWWGHLEATGWVIRTPNPAWSGHRKIADIPLMLRNTAVLGWRALDYGRIGLWALLPGGMWVYRKQRLPIPINLKLAIGGVVAPILALAPVLIATTNPTSHRYLLPAFLWLTLSALLWMQQNPGIWRGWLVAASMILVSGNGWVYPRQIAQAWDCTPAHLPYYTLRNSAIDWLSRQGIPFDSVGTQFPNIGPREIIDLNGEASGFAPADLTQQRYILYSNVMNDFSDAELAELTHSWNVAFRAKKGLVECVVYAR